MISGLLETLSTRVQGYGYPGGDNVEDTDAIESTMRVATSFHVSQIYFMLSFPLRVYIFYQVALCPIVPEFMERDDTFLCKIFISIVPVCEELFIFDCRRNRKLLKHFFFF